MRLSSVEPLTIADMFLILGSGEDEAHRPKIKISDRQADQNCSNWSR